MDVHTLIASVSILVPMLSSVIPDKGSLPLLVVGVISSFAWMTLEATLNSTIFFWVAAATFLINVVLTIGYVFSPLLKESL